MTAILINAGIIAYCGWISWLLAPLPPEKREIQQRRNAIGLVATIGTLFGGLATRAALSI